MKFIEDVSEYLQSIRLLDINCDENFFNLEDDSIYLKSVKEFHITLFPFDSLPRIPFTFDQLENVELTFNYFKLNDNVKNFIRENVSLKKLTVCTYGSPVDPDSIKSNLAKISPSLIIEFVDHPYSIMQQTKFPKETDF